MIEGNLKISELPAADFDVGSFFVADDLVSGNSVTNKQIVSDITDSLLDSFAYTQAGLQTTSKIPVEAVEEVGEAMGLSTGDKCAVFWIHYIPAGGVYTRLRLTSDLFTDPNVCIKVYISENSAIEDVNIVSTNKLEIRFMRSPDEITIKVVVSNGLV